MTTPTVFLHIGLPKTGTTFLQARLAECRGELQAQGLTYPGQQSDHFLAVQDVMRHRFRGHLDPRAKGTWQQMTAETMGSQQNAIISHEIMARAQHDQIQRVVESFPNRDIQLIVTVRDLARQLPAVWQEDVKNGSDQTLDKFVEMARSTVSDTGAKRGFWNFQDLPLILERWSRWVPDRQVHIITVPPRGQSRTLLWLRFAEALQVHLREEAALPNSENKSLGAAEVEFLRRVNEQIFSKVEWPQYRALVKNFLARRLVATGDQVPQPVTLSASDLLWAIDRSHAMAKSLATHNFIVHGSLADLEATADQPQPPSISEQAVADVGVRAISSLLRRIGRQEGVQ